ncbi:hypothetical protein BO83DRAFT_167377 [Aspergillus eucalypticola CBS 122712]|uniref:Uncharacterized protein n=1 Tax=Aspergillus eucalypticola (strain CBS 122712 / IBT 29274) TaxID=1448314 RepID=A0A317W6U5_ASPEC|nr:uncharacterized protein BO83DRAFT_167377 [Aspergillus eucalypticola CBS 122712]PWY80982.1 hypothetical protein BO83DRAFT_167377 [Aspergillus eucalypticola CBS 122712]
MPKKGGKKNKGKKSGGAAAAAKKAVDAPNNVVPANEVEETVPKSDSELEAVATEAGVTDTTAPEAVVPETVTKDESEVEAVAAETAPAVTAAPVATVTDTAAPVPAPAPPVKFTEEASNAVNTAFPKINDGIVEDAAQQTKTAQAETVEEGTSK